MLTGISNQIKPSSLKKAIQKNGLLLALLLLSIGGAPVLYLLGKRDDIQLYTPSVAGLITFFYLAQKQKLEKLKLLKELFTDFNQRYRKLNAPLTEIHRGTGTLSNLELDVLDEYFNLCAEEYYFYKSGYIDEAIWSDWCRGIMFYFDNPRIRRRWETEELNQSYYGLTLSKIEFFSRMK